MARVAPEKTIRYRPANVSSVTTDRQREVKNAFTAEKLGDLSALQGSLPTVDKTSP
jgi:hypothetical protein